MDGQNTLAQQRLSELHEEYHRGEQQMALLEQKRQELRDTLLRIRGAIQVLEELIAAEAASAPNGKNGARQPAAEALS